MINDIPGRPYRARAKDIRETLLVAASFAWMATSVLTLLGVSRIVWRIW